VIKKRSSWYDAYEACHTLTDNNMSTLAHTYVHTKAFQTLINQKTTYMFNGFWVGFTRDIWLWKTTEGIVYG
jgi:hypothetical protein